MAGRVPKFGPQNGGGGFTEVFALAQTGATTGSGDAATAPTEPKRAVGPRRSGSSDRDDGSNRARGGRGTGSTGGRKTPRSVSEEYGGAGHLPKFGDWNTSDAGDANYTVMFSAASRERQSGSAVELGSKNSSGGRSDVNRSSHGSKKHSPSWWCFS